MKKPGLFIPVLLPFLFTILSAKGAFCSIADNVAVTSSSGTDVSQDIYTAKNGEVYITYIDSGATEGVLMFAKSSDGGETFSTPVVVDAGNIDHHPRIRVFESTTNTIYILFSRVSGSGNDVYLARSTDDGATFTILPVVTNQHCWDWADLAVDTVGYIYVVYSDDLSGVHNVYMIVSADSGASFGSPFVVTATGWEEFGPVIAVRGGGAASVAYVAYMDIQWDGSKNIRYRKIENAGSSPVITESVNVGRTSHEETIIPGCLAVSGGDTAHIVYTYSNSSSHFTVIYKRIVGRYMSTEVLTPFDSVNYNPRVDLDAYSNVFVVWTDASSADTQVVLAIWEDDGPFSFRVFVNDTVPVAGNFSPAVSVTREMYKRRVGIAWLDTRSGNIDVYASVRLQFRNGLQPDLAFGGLSTAAGFVPVVHYTWGDSIPGTLTFVPEDSLVAWCDSGSVMGSYAFSTGSGMFERWACLMDSSWNLYNIDDGGNFWVVTYYHQYYVTPSVEVYTGGEPLTEDNGIVICGTQLGVTDTLDTLWSGHSGECWLDRATYLVYSPYSLGSTDTERWQANYRGDPVSYFIFNFGSRLAVYYHQYRCDVELDGTDASHTVWYEEHRFFGASEPRSGMYGTVVTWTDRGFVIDFSDSTTGSPPYRTLDPTFWTVTGHLVKTIRYAEHPLPPTPTSMVMTAVSPHSIQVEWEDFLHEDAYFIANWSDTTLVPGTDTLPPNTLIDTVYGLLENTEYHWLVVGIVTTGHIFTEDDVAYTLCEPPTGATLVDDGDGFIFMAVDEFPNDDEGLSGYFWECVEGGEFGGRDTVVSGRNVVLITGLENGHWFTYHVHYVNGDGIVTPEYEEIRVYVGEARDYPLSWGECLQRGWNMVSVSVDPIPQTPFIQFSDDIWPFYTTTVNSNVYAYAESVGVFYVPSNLYRGDGFFLYLWDECTYVDVHGISNFRDVTKYLSNTPTSRDPGWHIIGNPFLRNIYWSDIISAPGTMNLYNFYYHWTGYGWAFYSPYFSVGGLTNSIPAWMGIEVLAGSGGAMVQMQYPQHYPKARNQRGEGLISSIQISAASEDAEDRYNFAFLVEEGRMKDYLFPENPPPTTDFVALYFIGQKDFDYTTTGVEEFDGKRDEYRFDFEVRRVGGSHDAPVYLRFDTDTLPDGYSAFIIDRETGEEFELSSIGEYSYKPDGNFVGNPYQEWICPMLAMDKYPGDVHRFTLVIKRASEIDRFAPVCDGFVCLYPNPFNLATQLVINLTEESKVTLEVYNILGQRVSLIESGRVPAGVHTYTWSGKSDGGEPLPSGVYLVLLRVDESRFTQKLMLLK
ncbi:T9SS type A sorting domain-containing protein [bacterium]|nr:T9SS type A sorting domain-containing protein [bacterium]